MGKLDNIDMRALVVFSSPVAELVKFADMLLVRLENGSMYMSTDGAKWDMFLFNPIAADVFTGPEHGL